MYSHILQTLFLSFLAADTMPSADVFLRPAKPSVLPFRSAKPRQSCTSHTVLILQIMVAATLVFGFMSRWALNIATESASHGEAEAASKKTRRLEKLTQLAKPQANVQEPTHGLPVHAEEGKEAKLLDLPLQPPDGGLILEPPDAVKEDAAAVAAAAAADVPVVVPRDLEAAATELSQVHLSFTATAWGETKRSLTLRLLPQHSTESVRFLQESAAAKCTGELYRVEAAFLIQGRIACRAGQTRTRVVKGTCPSGVSVDKSRACPAHDPNCGCHGPIMTQGMVGWAGGGAGPDWFVYLGDGPATHWVRVKE